jgi:hypothetical protein
MINQIYSVTPTKTRNSQFPATETLAGTPMFVGSLPCINLDAYQSNVGGATCYFDGAYSVSVTAKSSLSPSVGADIKPGDPIYAVGGTLDAGTNVLTGFTLCADSSGTLWGYLDPTETTIASATTNSAATVSIAGKI